MRQGLGAMLLATWSCLVLCLMLGALVTPSARANVIGIDLGVDFMKVGAKGEHSTAGCWCMHLCS